jgi:hypothetical protein
MVTRDGRNLDTFPGFAVGIVMTTRPFPYTRTLVSEPIGLPILFEGDLTERDHAHLHFAEVGLEGGQLVTAGYHGWTMVVTGTGPTIAEAQADAYRLVRRVVIPDVATETTLGQSSLQAISSAWSDWDCCRIEHRSGRILRQPQLSAVSLKAAPSALQPHQRTFGNSEGNIWLCRDERVDGFGVPGNRVFHIEDRV